MELRHLRAFVAVAEEAHFGRAAQRLHMAQPPLSQQVKQLERELGVLLLERTTRRVRTTNAGVVFLERARAILSDVERARESVLLAERGESGVIRVGLTGATTWRLLPRLARAYRKRYPMVRLELQPAVFSGQQVSALLDNSIDVGFLRAPVPPEPLTGRVLLNEPLVAALPAEHQLARLDSVDLAAMADENFVSYPSLHGSSLRDAAFLACASVGFTPGVVQVAPDTHTVVSLVSAGVGVALLPASVESLRFEGVAYRSITGADVWVPICLAWRANDSSPVLAGFLTVADEILPDAPPRTAPATLPRWSSSASPGYVDARDAER